MTLKLVLIFILTLIRSCHPDTPVHCPSGCRCSRLPVLNVSGVQGGHLMQRLLVAYRSQRMVYGGEGYRRGGPVMEAVQSALGPGREMTCIGLHDLPQDIPADVRRVSIVGEAPIVHRVPSMTDQGDSPFLIGGKYTTSSHNQITSLKHTVPLPNNLKVLTLEGNKINVLRDHDLEMLSGLHTLRMRDNVVKFISRQAFKPLRNLQELDMGKNHIKKMNKHTFLGLKSLVKLILSQNQIESLHSHIFRGLVSLEEIDLSDNKLKDLHSDIFKTNLQLTHINLNNNNLRNIKRSWFKHLNFLNKITLDGNHILRLRSFTFQTPSLIHLSLSGNRISKISPTAFHSLHNVQTLDMSKNNITQLQDYIFHNMTSLQVLNLKENIIEKLTNSTLAGLIGLQKLNFAHNLLKDVPHSVLAKSSLLQFIDISHNKLKIVHRRNFFGLYDLRELRLDYNEIREIQDEAFAVSLLSAYSKLTWLYMGHNRISTLSNSAFIGLSYLKFFNLGYNDIKVLGDGAFSMLKRLNTLMLNDNKLQNLEPYIFKDMQYIQHISLAHNSLKVIYADSFRGLTKLEDVNLQHNMLEDVAIDSFFDSPDMISLDLRGNELRSFDLGIVDKLSRLKYLDLSKNLLQSIQMPMTYRQQLYFLALNDNNLKALDQRIKETITTQGSIHLQGNPWLCDCHLTWLHNMQYDSQVKTLEADEIVCKTPRYLTGEKVFSLEPSDFECKENYLQSAEMLLADQPSHVTETGIQCTYVEDAANENNLERLRATADEVLDWMVSIYNRENGAFFCSGVRLSSKWILTSSDCWDTHKLQNSVLMKFHSKGSLKSNQGYPANIVEISPAPNHVGANVTLVRIGNVTHDLEQTVFPCVLSNEVKNTGKETPIGIFTISEENPEGIDFINTLFQFKMDDYCKKQFKGHELCLSGTAKNVQLKERYDAPLFTKVDRSKWALAGWGSHADENIMTASALYPLIPWIERTLLF